MTSSPFTLHRGGIGPLVFFIFFVTACQDAPVFSGTLLCYS